MEKLKESTNLIVDQLLTELLGGCYHVTGMTSHRMFCHKCNKEWSVYKLPAQTHKLYTTSYNDIIPVIAGLNIATKKRFMTVLFGPVFERSEGWMFMETPRRLTEIVIQTLSSYADVKDCFSHDYKFLGTT